jgi:hypothetical protein
MGAGRARIDGRQQGGRCPDARRSSARPPGGGHPLSFLLVACVLAVALPAVLAGCGGGEKPTTTTTSGQVEETTTTGLPGSLTTLTTERPVVSDTTTSLAVEETTTTASTAEGETTTTEKLSTAEQRLSNGHIKAMGYIKSVSEKNGKRYISIDYAELLTGQAAFDAAIAAGEIQEGEELPNDYYIRNVNTEKRQFEVSASVDITTSTWHGEQNNPVTWDVFKSFWSVSPPDEEAGFLRDSPWWIERDGQTVIKIDEQYLP